MPDQLRDVVEVEVARLARSTALSKLLRYRLVNRRPQSSEAPTGRRSPSGSFPVFMFGRFLDDVQRVPRVDQPASR
jgi:hypothetical protein